MKHDSLKQYPLTCRGKVTKQLLQLLIVVMPAILCVNFSNAIAQDKFEVRIGTGGNQIIIEDDGPRDQNKTPNTIYFSDQVDLGGGKKLIIDLTVIQKIVPGKSAELKLGPVTITNTSPIDSPVAVTDETILINSSKFVPIGPPFTGTVHLAGRYTARQDVIRKADVSLQGSVFPVGQLPQSIGTVDPPGVENVNQNLAGNKFGPDQGHTDKSKKFDVAVERLSYFLQFTVNQLDRIRLENSATVSGYTAEKIFVVNSVLDQEDGDISDGICDIGSANPGNPNFPLKGLCPLRAALVESDLSNDQSPAPNAIHFNIPVQGVPIIQVSQNVSFNAGSLGALRPVIVDGTTQSAGMVELDGSLAVSQDISGRPVAGLDFVGSDIAVKGFVVTGFPSHAIQLRPSGGPVGFNLVEGNFVMKNGGDGVRIFEMPNNLVADNFIRQNLGVGISVEGGNSNGNRLQGNFIGVNQGLGIDLIGNANNQQPAPVLLSATSSDGNLDIQGTLAGASGKTFNIQFFVNTQCDPSAFGEGEDFIGSVEVAFPAAITNFSISLPVSVPSGGLITAIATDPDNNSSEFSKCLLVVQGAPKAADLELTKQADKSTLPVGGQVSFTIKLINKGPDPATNIVVKDLLPADISFNQAITSMGSYDAGTGLWLINTLNNGSEATLIITGTVIQAGTVTNTAELIASDQLDPDSSPGNANASEDDQSSFSVQVTDALGVDAQIKFLISQINNLVNQGQLSRRHGKILVEILNVSLELFNRGFARASILTMRAFILSVKELVNRHQLSKEAGQALIQAAQKIIAQMESAKQSIDSQGSRANMRTGNEDKQSQFRLYPNSPNPFYAATVISFDLPVESMTEVNIYDVTGKKIMVLLNRVMPAGKHSITWQPKNLSGGMYILRFKAGNYFKTQRMAIIK